MRLLAIPALMLLAACGASKTQAADPPAVHRAVAVACAANGNTGPACTADAQCQTLSPGPGQQAFCLQGRCGADQCIDDGDCPNGGVCSCAGQTRGQGGASANNSCVTSGCRTDADCGSDGYCSPTLSYGCGPFYGVQGYYCHHAGDACTNDSDCGGDGGAGQAYCAYDPQSGRWACSSGFCAG